MGIRVMAVAPGNVKTPLWRDAQREGYVNEQEGDVWIEVEEVAVHYIFPSYGLDAELTKFLMLGLHDGNAHVGCIQRWWRVGMLS